MQKILTFVILLFCYTKGLSADSYEINCNNELFPEPPCCGIAKEQTQKGRIVGGTVAKRGEFPWMAIVDGCGGALINSQWVLTAAHCCILDILEINLGRYNFEDPHDGVVAYDVKAIFNHENYNPITVKNDIALVQLKEPVNFNDRIQPICLDYHQSYTNEIVGKAAIVAGWGDTEFNGSYSPVLKEASVEIWNTKRCEAFGSWQLNGNLQLCAGGEGGVDACQGDSGGPLSLRMPANEEGYPFYEVGIVSTGYKCAIKGYPGVYTNVAAYIPWIKDVIEKNSY